MDDMTERRVLIAFSELGKMTGTLKRVMNYYKALGIPTDDLERVEELLYAELSGLTALLPASLRDGARLK